MSFEISTKSTVSIPKALIEKINESIGLGIQKVITKSLPEIKEEIREQILSKLRATSVYQGLETGAEFGGTNLRAEFGLTDQMAEIAADRLLQIVDESIKDIKLSGEPNSRFVKFEANINALNVEEVSEELKHDSAFSYDNQEDKGKEDVEITWMEWLLDEILTPLEDVDAAIVYLESIDDQNILKRLSGRSRSGRAVMVQPTFDNGKPNPAFQYAKNYPYQLPSAYIPKGSAKNFIEAITKDNVFIGRLKNIVQVQLNVAINRLK